MTFHLPTPRLPRLSFSAFREKLGALSLALGLFLLATPLCAGPFSGAASEAAADVTAMSKAAGPVLGILFLVIGAAIAGYKAVKGEPSWTTNLIFAIIGVAIAAVV